MNIHRLWMLLSLQALTICPVSPAQTASSAANRTVPVAAGTNNTAGEPEPFAMDVFTGMLSGPDRILPRGISAIFKQNPESAEAGRRVFRLGPECGNSCRCPVADAVRVAGGARGLIGATAGMGAP